MPKLIDHAGRFAFFEEACFAIVRDHGPQHLSRHRVAHVLGSSISTVRRLLSSEADLRNLALSEVGHRRRAGRWGQPPGEGPEAALWVLRRLVPDTAERVAEELVWWRLAVAAPTRADVRPDPASLEEGPLHHRFAVANLGFVPMDVRHLAVDPPTPSCDQDGVLDPVVKARDDRDELVAAEVERALAHIASLDGDRHDRAGALLRAIVDGVGVGVCLGRLAPEDAVSILRSQLACL